MLSLRYKILVPFRVRIYLQLSAGQTIIAFSISTTILSNIFIFLVFNLNDRFRKKMIPVLDVLLSLSLHHFSQVFRRLVRYSSG